MLPKVVASACRFVRVTSHVSDSQVRPVTGKGFGVLYFIAFFGVLGPIIATCT